MSQLLSPVTIGDLTLRNKVVLAPLTRARADPETRNPTLKQVLYYSQRAAAGLIITEGSAVSEQGHGWYGAPGCYTNEHVTEWKKVVDAVHAKGGVIFLQLWHTGRQGHPSFHLENEVLSASAIHPGGTATTRDVNGKSTSFVTPREITIAEIAGVVQDFKRSAQLAKEAGFDGVEVSGGGGYIVDTFLQSSSNKRADQYGGPKENRYRFLKEITEALIEVYPANRVAIKITSNGSYGGMGSADNAEAFLYYAEQLSQYGLAYLHVMDGPGFGFHTLDRQLTLFDFKKAFNGPILAVVGFTKDIAEGVIRSGAADLVAFGRPYISNPDLVERFTHGFPLAPDPPYEHWWNNSLGAVGYTDNPDYQVPSDTVVL